jgi:Flp pilus assembly pilin Flp
MMTMLSIARQLIADETGVTLIEYALLTALIAAGAIVAMQQLGESLTGLFDHASSTLQNASN